MITFQPQTVIAVWNGTEQISCQVVFPNQYDLYKGTSLDKQ